MTTMLQTVPACAHRVADLAALCADRQTRGFEDLRCDGRRDRGEACVTRSIGIGTAPVVVVLTTSRKWTHGALQRAVEAALGGRKAFRDAYDVAWDRERCSHSIADLHALLAASDGPWANLRAGSLAFRARLAIHHTAVLKNTYTAVEVSIPGCVGEEPHWYHMAARANAS